MLETHPIHKYRAKINVQVVCLVSLFALRFFFVWYNSGNKEVW